MVELFLVPLGHNRFAPIVVRNGNVTLEQFKSLVGSDGLGLELIKVQDFTPETLVEILESTKETEVHDGS